jgi:hypothetical protein
MPKKLISELKEYFKATKRPTESQFADLLDSYAHLDGAELKRIIENINTENGFLKLKNSLGDIIAQISMTDLRNSLNLSSNLETFPGTNLVNSKPYWKPGNNTIPFFNNNGSISDNIREYGLDPFNDYSILWKCMDSDTVADPDGGWNTDYFQVDQNFAYRYTVWIKKKDYNAGSYYHGCHNVNNLDGSFNSNPYFMVTGTLPLDEWLLMVGVIHESSYSGTSMGISGIYDAFGNKITDGTEFKWPGTAGHSTNLRNYLYYSQNIGNTLYFWNPGFFKMDGNEPPLNRLFPKNFAWRNVSNFENGVTNFMNNYEIARFKKVNDVVHLQGKIKGGSSQTAGQSYKLFRLPNGYRPSQKITVLGNSSNTLGSLDIDTDGWVYGVVYNSQGFSLSGISFIAV